MGAKARSGAREDAPMLFIARACCTWSPLKCGRRDVQTFRIAAGESMTCCFKVVVSSVQSFSSSGSAVQAAGEGE